MIHPIIDHPLKNDVDEEVLAIATLCSLMGFKS